MSQDPGTPNFDPVASQWKLLLTLSVAGLLASASLNVFLLKQNRMLTFQRKQQQEQFARTRQMETALRSLVQDVASFSLQYPEARGILSKYGIQVNPAPPPVAPPMAPAASGRPAAPLPPGGR
ncbi:MAG: hypothetical protein HUU04_10360 [Verrucomicrobiae bacterium]|nr:hypothetical protein [Verrucomicrobiae bacterium]